MFKLFLVSATLLLSAQVFAQEFTISGSVRDSKTNQPLPGATLQVQGIKRYAVADDFGRFLLEKISAGEHTLVAKFLGYSDKVEIISVNQNLSITLALEESVQLTDEVVVFATRANEKTPATYTNVNHQSIQKQNFGQDLPFLLNWTPSLVTTSDAGAGVGYTGLRIRGSDATRINVTINGIPYNDAESQGTFWVDVPDIASSTQSIQIQRGVGTSTNGASAFGATVNLQTNALQSDPYTEAIVAAGSFNTQRYTLRAGTGLINNHWSFDTKVSKITSDGYIDRASSDLTSYYISGGYYGKKTIIKAITFGGHEKTYQAWYGVDGETLKTDRTRNFAGEIYDDNWNVVGHYDNQVDNYRQDHYQFHLSQQLNDHWSGNVSLHYTYGRGYYEQYQQSGAFEDFGLSNIQLKDTLLTTSDFITRKWLDNDFYGTTFSLSYAKDKNNFIVGGGFNKYDNAKHFGEIIWAQYSPNIPIRHHFYEGESEKNDFNIYGKWNYELTTSLNAFVDLQYRYVKYKTAGVDDDQNAYSFNDKFNFFNPKAGITYSLTSEDILYGSYAVANREPNRTDYLENEVKPKSERLRNLELGWRRNSSRYNFTANYYLMNYKDQLVLTGELNNVGNPIRANVGKSYRTGVELAGGILLSDKLSLNANATWSVNKNKNFVLIDETTGPSEKNTTIILSPTWIAGSQISYTVFKNFQASLLSKYVGKQYLDNSENKDLTLDSYFINDLRFNYSFQFKSIKGLDLSLLINNLFDVEYSSNGYAWGDTAYYYPQAGRNFLIMASIKF